ELIALWEACGLVRPWNKPEKDIAFARGKDQSDIIVGVIEESIVASLMVGHDGHRGSFYYVAVAPPWRGQGIGSLLIREGEKWLKERGVWKVNLLIRQENSSVQNFYEQLGYEVNRVMSMGQRLIED
ncbi:MAG TPA: GNAT family acetyltransferase, partial [Aestuariivirgaceae bacterium]